MDIIFIILYYPDCCMSYQLPYIFFSVLLMLTSETSRLLCTVSTFSTQRNVLRPILNCILMLRGKQKSHLKDKCVTVSTSFSRPTHFILLSILNLQGRILSCDINHPKVNFFNPQI